MPWCPNCNAEYQEGYTKCSDCDVDLVDSLETPASLVPFFHAEDKKLAEKLVSYLNYSKLPSEVGYDEEHELYLVKIPPKMEKQARKLYQAFYFVERENIANGIYKDEETDPTPTEPDTHDEIDEDMINLSPAPNPMEETLVDEYVSEHAKENETEDDFELIEEAVEEGVDKGVYVFKADRYKDLAGTVWIFLFFGVVGLLFVILNMAGILSFLNGWMPNTIMGAMFLFFLYTAFNTRQRAQKIRHEIDDENKLTKEINEWLKDNVTENYLTSIYNDEISEELNYIKMTDTIKEQLLKNFGNQNLSYLDRLVEEYYNNNF